MKRTDWSGTKPGEKMGDGILKTGVFKNIKKETMSGKKRVEITIISYWTQKELNEYKKAFTDDLRIVYVWTKLKKGDKVCVFQKSGK